MATEIWLTITNVRLSGTAVEVLVQGEAGDDREGTWLPCTQTQPVANELYGIVLKALQDQRKTTGKLTSPSSTDELVIAEIRVQYQ